MMSDEPCFACSGTIMKDNGETMPWSCDDMAQGCDCECHNVDEGL